MPNPESRRPHSPTPDPRPTIPGRVVAVDYGTVRIGLAISDPARTLASPLSIYARRDKITDAAFFKRLAAEERVARFVVGLPVHNDGRESQKSFEAREFGRWLGETTNVPVDYFDERFTTAQAEEHLLAAGLTKKRRKERLDKLAAQILLAAYLEAGCRSDEAPQGLEDRREVRREQGP
ncbi:MAG: Holliday junction resolvase RuvX [Planctomycetota bacterium]|nr:MAG: Holliday junction resolvase RuvX [Planctomycetota bacterium]